MADAQTVDTTQQATMNPKRIAAGKALAEKRRQARQQVTSQIPVTSVSQMNPKRIAAGKALAEKRRQARELMPSTHSKAC